MLARDGRSLGLSELRCLLGIVVFVIEFEQFVIGSLEVDA